MKPKTRNTFLICLAILVLSACSTPASPTAQPTSAPLPPQETATLPPTSVPTLAVTPTPAPTEAPTEASTATLEASSTPQQNLALAQNGFQIWCMPVDSVLGDMKQVVAPQNARIGAYVSYLGKIRVTIPASSCTLAYTFNQPMPADVQLEAHYFYGGQPWLTTKLIQAPDNPAVGYVTLTQEYAINPPGVWSVDYQFVVKQGTNELRKDTVSFSKDVTRCWEGSLPDPVTLRCPKSDAREPEIMKSVTPSNPNFIK
jgi:hypothetical protein